MALYTTGLAITHSGSVTPSVAPPGLPLALTDSVPVFFGDSRIGKSEVIVDWSGCDSGKIGVYRINLRKPGSRMSRNNLPVTIRIRGVDSPQTGMPQATVAVD
jgi:uncharacterized protein (TIGR03437 family)